MSIFHWAGLLILGFIMHSKMNRLRLQINDLRRRLDDLSENGLRPAATSVPVATEASATRAPDQMETIAAPLAEPPYATVSVSAPLPAHTGPVEMEVFEHEYQDHTPPYAPEKLAATQSAFEFKIGAKLPVWIGAFCLICAGFFLIKYSIEVGFLGPAVRTTFAGIFGLAFIAAGKSIGSRPAMANSERICNGLIGAGIVTLYFTFYAAVNMYHLLPPPAGFAGMVAVTVVAVVLSLRHGQAISVFGLIGGLLTPALISSQAPSAAALFGYLSFFGAASIFVMARQGWWKMVLATVIGLFMWVGIWGMNVGIVVDRYIIVLFGVAIMAAVLAAISLFLPEKKEARTIADTAQIVSIAAAFITLFVLATNVVLTMFDWGMVGALSVACIYLAWRREEVYLRVAAAKLAADLLLFLFSVYRAEVVDSYLVGAGIFTLFTIVPIYIVRTQANVRIWAAMQSIAAIGVYSICYMADQLHHSVNVASYGVAGILLAALFILQIVRARSVQKGPDVEWISAVYGLAVGGFISIACLIMLPAARLPLAIAIEIAVTLCLLYRFRFDFIGRVGLALSVVFVAVSFPQIELFLKLISAALTDSRPYGLSSAAFNESYVFAILMPAMIISMASIWTLSVLRDMRFMKVASIMAATLILAALYFPLRQAFDGASFLSIEAGFGARAAVTTSFILLGIGLLRFLPIMGYKFYRNAALIVLTAGFARIFYFDLLIDNPYFSSKEYVGSYPIFNGVTYVYGLGAAVMAWCLYSVREISARLELSAIYKICVVGLVFAFVSLTVRQIFHGGILMGGNVTALEMYSYSAAWLLTSIALLTVGMKRDNRPVRIGAMGFMALTVAKVFLVDAGELTGLYRIFSFFGLGVSLIGLSYFYTKFVSAKDGQET